MRTAKGPSNLMFSGFPGPNLNSDILIDYIVDTRGGDRDMWQNVADMIAYHETGPHQRMDPRARQITDGGGQGPGRGLFQFEDSTASGSFDTAKQRYKNTIDAVRDRGYVLELDPEIMAASNADELTEDQQRAIFYANLIQGPASLRDYAEGNMSLEDLWLKGHKLVEKEGNRGSFRESVSDAQEREEPIEAVTREKGGRVVKYNNGGKGPGDSPHSPSRNTPSRQELMEALRFYDYMFSNARVRDAVADRETGVGRSFQQDWGRDADGNLVYFTEEYPDFAAASLFERLYPGLEKRDYEDPEVQQELYMRMRTDPFMTQFMRENPEDGFASVGYVESQDLYDTNRNRPLIMGLGHIMDRASEKFQVDPDLEGLGRTAVVTHEMSHATDKGGAPANYREIIYNNLRPDDEWGKDVAEGRIQYGELTDPDRETSERPDWDLEHRLRDYHSSPTELIARLNAIRRMVYEEEGGSLLKKPSIVQQEGTPFSNEITDSQLKEYAAKNEKLNEILKELYAQYNTDGVLEMLNTMYKDGGRVIKYQHGGRHGDWPPNENEEFGWEGEDDDHYFPSSVATRQDSLDAYEAAVELARMLDEQGYVIDTIRPYDDSKWQLSQHLRRARGEYTDEERAIYNALRDEGILDNHPAYQGVETIDDYYGIYDSATEGDVTRVREMTTGNINESLPLGYYDTGIAPQGLVTASGTANVRDTKTNKTFPGGDMVEFPYYDPVAVKPYDLLTEEEKKERLEKYDPEPIQQEQKEKVRIVKQVSAPEPEPTPQPDPKPDSKPEPRPTPEPTVRVVKEPTGRQPQYLFKAANTGGRGSTRGGQVPYAVKEWDDKRKQWKVRNLTEEEIQEFRNKREYEEIDFAYGGRLMQMLKGGKL